MVSFTLPPAPPHQFWAGTRLHSPSRLVAFRATLTRPHGGRHDQSAYPATIPGTASSGTEIAGTTLPESEQIGTIGRLRAMGNRSTDRQITEDGLGTDDNGSGTHQGWKGSAGCPRFSFAGGKRRKSRKPAPPSPACTAQHREKAGRPPLLRLIIYGCLSCAWG